jgi:uncharacterized protein with ATP-grasp and redox domains
MSVEEYGDQPVAKNDFTELIDKFSKDQEDLFSSVRDFLGNPYRKSRAAVFNENTIVTQNTFRDIVPVIAEDDQFSVEERAQSIATLYFAAREERLEVFRDLAPKADYDEGEATNDHVVENILDYFKAGMSPDMIADEVADNYARSLAVDLQELLNNAEPNLKLRAIATARSLGSHAVEFGKIAGAVAIGTVAAGQVMKKFRR